MSTEAQLKSLSFQLNSGKLKTNRAKVLNFVKDNSYGVTFKTVANHFNMKEHAAVGRLSELKYLGLIFVKDKTLTNNSKYYYEENVFEQRKRRQLLHYERFVSWAKKSNEFKDYLSEEVILNMVLINNIYPK